MPRAKGCIHRVNRCIRKKVSWKFLIGATITFVILAVGCVVALYFVLHKTHHSSANQTQSNGTRALTFAFHTPHPSEDQREKDILEATLERYKEAAIDFVMETYSDVTNLSVDTKPTGYNDALGVLTKSFDQRTTITPNQTNALLGYVEWLIQHKDTTQFFVMLIPKKYVYGNDRIFEDDISLFVSKLKALLTLYDMNVVLIANEDDTAQKLENNGVCVIDATRLPPDIAADKIAGVIRQFCITCFLVD